MDEEQIIWQPQPRQAEFLSRWEDEALYGGAAGGGKTDALVMEALRQQNIGSVSELKYGLIETNGQLSYIYKPEYQPVNAKMLGIKPADAGLPLIVISDGEVVEINLRHLGKTREEIEKRVQKAHISGVSEVFLMTLDDSGNEFIQRKER